MGIQKPTIVRMLESSDAQVVVEPFADGIQLSIEGSVMNQYGRQIKAAVLETLEHFGIKNDKITTNGKGVLGCTLKACAECVVFRGCGASRKDAPRGGVVK